MVRLEDLVEIRLNDGRELKATVLERNWVSYKTKDDDGAEVIITENFTDPNLDAGDRVVLREIYHKASRANWELGWRSRGVWADQGWLYFVADTINGNRNVREIKSEDDLKQYQEIPNRVICNIDRDGLIKLTTMGKTYTMYWSHENEGTWHVITHDLQTHVARESTTNLANELLSRMNELSSNREIGTYDIPNPPGIQQTAQGEETELARGL